MKDTLCFVEKTNRRNANATMQKIQKQKSFQIRTAGVMTMSLMTVARTNIARRAKPKGKARHARANRQARRARAQRRR